MTNGSSLDGIVLLGTTEHSIRAAEDYREAALAADGKEIPFLHVKKDIAFFIHAVKGNVPHHWRHVLMLRDGFSWTRSVGEVAAMISLAMQAFSGSGPTRLLDGLLLAEPGQKYPCPGMVLFAPHIVTRTSHRAAIRVFRPDVAGWVVPPKIKNAFSVTRDELQHELDITGVLH